MVMGAPDDYGSRDALAPQNITYLLYSGFEINAIDKVIKDV